MMDFEITERRENELLNREEIDLDITHHGEATPSEHEVRKALAAELDLDPRTIRVDHVYSATGTATSRGTVTVFDEPVVEELPEDDDTGEEEDDTGDTEDEAADAEDADDMEEEADAADDAQDEEETAEEDSETEEETEESAEDDEKEGDA